MKVTQLAQHTVCTVILTGESDIGKSVLGLLPLVRPWSRSLSSVWSSEPMLSLEYTLSLSVGDLLFSRTWLSEMLRGMRECCSAPECSVSPADLEWVMVGWLRSVPLTASSAMPLSASAGIRSQNKKGLVGTFLCRHSCLPFTTYNFVCNMMSFTVTVGGWAWTNTMSVDAWQQIVPWQTQQCQQKKVFHLLSGHFSVIQMMIMSNYTWSLP